MFKEVNWTLRVHVIRAPKISASQTMAVAKYDKISKVI